MLYFVETYTSHDYYDDQHGQSSDIMKLKLTTKEYKHHLFCFSWLYTQSGIGYRLFECAISIWWDVEWVIETQ
jgi:hypothetical protein